MFGILQTFLYDRAVQALLVLLSNLMFHVVWTFSFANQYMVTLPSADLFNCVCVFHDGSVSEWHTVFIVNVDTARCKKDFSQQNYWLLRIQPYFHLCTSLCFWDKICEEVSFFFLTRCMWCKHYSKMQFFMKSEIQQKQAFWFCFTQLFMSLLLKWMTLRLSHNFLQNGIMCKL